MEGFARPNYGDCDGLRIPGGFSPEAFRSAINYKPKPGDLFIVTYPKCGTTWMQHIVMLILQKGKPLTNINEFMQNTPFLEMAGADAVDFMTGPGAIKIHLPLNLIQFSPDAKYIYVARNPKDCCVSFYHHTKKMFFYNFQDGTFDEYFDLFINDKTDYGDYFDNLLPWYERRHDDNVHFLTYEDLKKDTKGEVLKVAKFIGEEYYSGLLEDEEYMHNVLYYSSLEYMKKNANDYMDKLLKRTDEPSENVPMPSGLKYFFEFKAKYAPKEDKSSAIFVRKGIVGDWKGHFTREQEERMEQWIKRRTVGSDIMDIWKNI